MTLRAHCKDHIWLSPVSSSVRLHVFSQTISFYQRDKNGGARINYETVNCCGNNVDEDAILVIFNTVQSSRKAVVVQILFGNKVRKSYHPAQETNVVGVLNGNLNRRSPVRLL